MCAVVLLLLLLLLLLPLQQQAAVAAAPDGLSAALSSSIFYNNGTARKTDRYEYVGMMVSYNEQDNVTCAAAPGTRARRGPTCGRPTPPQARAARRRHLRRPWFRRRWGCAPPPRWVA